MIALKVETRGALHARLRHVLPNEILKAQLRVGGGAAEEEVSGGGRKQEAGGRK